MAEQTPRRTWMITGTSTGFGLAVARAALAAGDRVVATARRTDTLARLVREAPDRVLALPLDVTDPRQVTDAVRTAEERFGGIDVLVNNAGHGSVGAVEEIDVAELRTLHEVMFIGPVRLAQAVLPGMRRRRRGAIVQISSMGGQVSMPGFGAYCSAKFALEAVSESLAAEVGPLGISVLIVEPGAFRTEFGGHRMHRSAPAIDDYATTVGPARTAVDAMDGTQPGDPARAAAAILRLVGSPTAPLRLALGDDAVDTIRAKHARLTADLDGWEGLSRSTAL